MTYLSRIHLNPLRSQARRLLRNPQAMHAAVLGGIPTQPVNERVLWRLDTLTPHRPSLLVLTESAPSWDHLLEQAGWPGVEPNDGPQVEVRSYRPLLERLADGDTYRFRLTANPTSATKQPERLKDRQRNRLERGDTTRSVRIPHTTPDHQVAWLVARTERLGFDLVPARSSEAVGEPLPDVAVVGRERLSFRKNGGGKAVTLHTATFEGRLMVRDASALRTAMTEGIGRAKAYGCGLLTLAPSPVGDPRG